MQLQLVTLTGIARHRHHLLRPSNLEEKLVCDLREMRANISSREIQHLITDRARVVHTSSCLVSRAAASSSSSERSERRSRNTCCRQHSSNLTQLNSSTMCQSRLSPLAKMALQAFALPYSPPSYSAKLRLETRFAVEPLPIAPLAPPLFPVGQGGCLRKSPSEPLSHHVAA